VFCQVSYLDWTRAGHLRGASFKGILSVPGQLNKCTQS
jgi:hypothetical protein